MPRSQGTGESYLVNPLTKEEHSRPVSDELLEAILTYSCSKWGVSIPKMVKYPDTVSGRFGGKYRTGKDTITYNKDVLGLILHELAHHIDYRTNGSYQHQMHGARFAEILQELLDLWR